MKEKFGIDTFYVGELCLSEKIDNYIYLKLQKEIKDKTVNGGAIKEQVSPFEKDYDERKRIRYDTFITLFKGTDYGYRCLHNGLSYTLDGDDYCKNLYPLSTFLPKVGYDIPYKVSTDEAIELFKKVFKDGSLELTEELRDINDFYIGDLCLCTKYYNICQEHRNNGFDHVNELSEYLINMSGLGYKESSHFGTEHYENFFYKKYKGVFININGFVFLHDNQKYNLGTLTGHLNQVAPGLSYYEDMVPYKDYMKKNGVRIEGDYLSPEKALKLFIK